METLGFTPEAALLVLEAVFAAAGDQGALSGLSLIQSLAIQGYMHTAEAPLAFVVMSADMVTSDTKHSSVLNSARFSEGLLTSPSETPTR